MGKQISLVTTISSGKDYIPDLYKNLASKFWTNKELVFDYLHPKS